jgi:hypothetical protein
MWTSLNERTAHTTWAQGWQHQHASIILILGFLKNPAPWHLQTNQRLKTVPLHFLDGFQCSSEMIVHRIEILFNCITAFFFHFTSLNFDERIEGLAGEKKAIIYH